MYFDKRYLYIMLIMLAFTSLINGRFNLLDVLYTLPGVLVAITFHEFAHAFAAEKLGDDTPRNQGRISLNPMSHLDPVGLFMLIFAHIGWGKPVEINPNKFTRKLSVRTSEAIVALAGPLMNFILAIIFTIIFYALQIFSTGFIFTNQIGIIIFAMIQYTIIVNVGLGVFNLIPLPPLDGSKILMAFLSYNARRWCEEHTMLFQFVFLIIWITPISSLIISPIISVVTNGIGSAVGGIFSLFV